VASGVAALEATSSDMECSRYLAMRSADQMATVDWMRSSMFETNKMPSSHEMANKVAVSCRHHPTMMIHEIIERMMPRTSVMSH
jgi:hypothetical protein